MIHHIKSPSVHCLNVLPDGTCTQMYTMIKTVIVETRFIHELTELSEGLSELWDLSLTN